MNKGIVALIGGVVVAGAGYGLYKVLNKKEKEAEKDLAETIDKVNKENPGLNILSDEELPEKKSLKDQDMFKDDVSESKEIAAINAIREAAGKKPVKVSKELNKFLGKGSKKSIKESLDNIAENIKKDPKLKKKILKTLREL